MSDNNYYLKIGIGAVIGIVLGVAVWKSFSTPRVKDEEEEEEKKEEQKQDEKFVDTDYDKTIDLSRDEAKGRFEAISDVNYELVLAFVNDSKSYNKIIYLFFK